MVMISEAINKICATIILGLIYAGIITSPDQLKQDVNEVSLQHLSGMMELENGNPGGYSVAEDIRRLLLTGSVPLNRMASSKWIGNTIEEVIMAKDGGYIQYASKTRNGFKTKKASERTVLLAKYLLIYGPICPSNVVYQGQGRNGSGVYDSIPVKGDKDELFCYQ